MTTPHLLTVPDRDGLRGLYDEAVRQINPSRPAIDLTTGFYAETGNAVFDAGYLALSDHCKGTAGKRRLHVVSAPAGGGKTSYSYALMLALTRYAEQTPEVPYGCVFVVDQIKKADEAFTDLNALMPGKVAVWTTEHDRGCKRRTKMPHPAAEFIKDELRHYPIIVVTHTFYNGLNGNKAHVLVRDKRVYSGRALTVVDERPEEVVIYQITLKEAQDVREKLQAKCPDLKQVLDKLMLFMMPYSFLGGGIVRASDHFREEFIADQLDWFTSIEAECVLRDHSSDISGLDQFFGFARAMTLGRAFAAPSSTVVHFVGWQSKLMVRPGMILLDATADIDGVSHICPWRQHVKTPQAHYGNLEIIHVPQHTRQRPSEYLKKAANQRDYVKWMVETIKEHMAPGEHGLVVCKKALFEAERVPQWPDGDPRFKAPESYTEQYGWDVEGRKLCASHYGTGIGSNAWRDADVVFLFDEFFIPRRVAAATVQGLRGQKANEGDLASMKTLNSRAHGVDLIGEGHRLRWKLTAEYVEAESGKRSDRPKLAKALAHAKAIGATVVFAKLDRLTRNVDLLRTLVASDVDLVFCDLPHVPPGAMGRFLLTQMASVAELEAGLISERTKAALAAAKARGVKLGNPNGARALRGKQVGNKQAVAVVMANAAQCAANLRAIVEDLRSQGFTSVRAIAAQLNERGILTPRGGAWHPTSAARLMSRLQTAN